MKKNSFLVILLLTFFFSCKRNSNKESSAVNNSDTTKFFQLTEYFQTQIKEVNATPFFIYRINITNNKKDSTPINTSIFNDLSKQFLLPDINDEKIKKYYKESIFEDQTTKSYTLSYTTTNKELELQSAQILLGEDAEIVNRIFLRKFYNYGDSSAIEQLTWKPGESFQVIRSVQKPRNSESVRQMTVVWDKKN